MRKFQLRTYHLRTEEAAAAYLPHWVLHVKSLELFGVAMHAFFSAPSAPWIVVALTSFSEHDDLRPSHVSTCKAMRFSKT